MIANHDRLARGRVDVFGARGDSPTTSDRDRPGPTASTALSTDRRAARAQADDGEPRRAAGEDGQRATPASSAAGLSSTVTSTTPFDRLAARAPSAEVPDHHDEADEVERPAEHAHDVHRADGEQRLDEVGVRQRAVGVGGLPHEALVDARDPHRRPCRGGCRRSRARSGRQRPCFECSWRAPEPRRQPVEHARGHQAVPAERAAVHVADDPVGVVRERRHGLDGQQRAFERGHAVEGDAGDEELEHRVLAHLVPRAAQREQAVEHAAPRRRPQHQR